MVLILIIMLIIGGWFGHFMGLNFNHLTNDKIKCIKKHKNIEERINRLKRNIK